MTERPLSAEHEARACDYGEVGCGQYYDCDRHAREKRAQAYRRLTPAQKAYDREVDPAGAYHTEFEHGCTCHINAPCSYCTREVSDDE